MNNMEYFGTNLTDHGHYRWILEDDRMVKTFTKFDDLPFHPESLTNNLPKGHVAFYKGGGFSVLAIAGSPVDTRPGTKSVFWVRANMALDGMVDIIKHNKAAMAIINAMPFEVQYFKK